jgi:hypothetical protein
LNLLLQITPVRTTIYYFGGRQEDNFTFPAEKVRALHVLTMMACATRLVNGLDARERQLMVTASCPEMQGISLANVHPEVLPLRDAGVNIIIRLVEAYESKAETLAHAIVLLDKLIAIEFCCPPDPSTSQRIVKAGVGCFMIAVKFREVMHPCVRDLAVLTSCSCDDIRIAEEQIVRVLEWNVNVTTGDALPSPIN